MDEQDPTVEHTAPPSVSCASTVGKDARKNGVCDSVALLRAEVNNTVKQPHSVTFTKEGGI